MIFSMRKFLIFLLIIFSINSLIFSIVLNVSASEDVIKPSDSDDLIIEFYIDGTNVAEEDQIDIYVNWANYSSPNQVIPDSELTIHKYHIYTGDVNNLAHVKEGSLDWYNQSDILWKKENINLAWTGQGQFYVTVEFKTEDMNQSYETSASDNPLFSYERYSILEIILIAVIIIGSVIGAVVIILVIRMRKQGGSMERTSKVSKKEIKISQISKDELKKVKKTEKKELKEKGKTEVKEDLIFSVPKWEIDEEEE